MCIQFLLEYPHVHNVIGIFINGLRLKSLLYILNDDFTWNLGLFGQLISGDNLVVVPPVQNGV